MHGLRFGMFPVYWSQFVTSSVWDFVIQQDQPRPFMVMDLHPFPGPVFAHDKGENKRYLFAVVDADYAAKPF
jgi:hypothetical protein